MDNIYSTIVALSKGRRIPDGSRIITSDDIFDYMLTVRTNNTEIAEEIESGEEHKKLKYSDTVSFNGLEDYEANRMQLLARQKSLKMISMNRDL